MGGLRFALLGPVLVTDGGEPLPGLAPRHRAVLAHLLLHAGTVIPMERLIEAVWGLDQPETARSQIHAAITALRRAMGGAEVLLTRPGGYLADPAPGSLDVREFSDLVAEGRLREALGLWRGEALADVHAHYAPAARALLADRRLAAIEQLMEAELTAGRHAAVLDELAGLVAAHPLRERLAGQLVTALHRSGRQADALAAARAYREGLAEEQGLDPGAGFLAVEQSALAASRSSFLPYDVPDFTGRDGELDRIVTDPRGGIVTVDGMAGVGKTTLAIRAAHRLAGRFPGGQLFADMSGHTASAVLEVLLRQLGLTEIPPTEAGRCALWRAELAARRVLVVLDNATDGGHVRPLLPGSSESLLLITSRRRLVDIDGARALSMEVLPPGDALALFAGIVGERAAAEPTAVTEVLGLCGHLPLAIRLAAARLQHRPRWSVSYLAGRLRLADLATPERSVAAAFTVSYEQLDPAEQRMFRLLGPAPVRDVEPHAAAALAGLPVPEAEDLLESLLDANLLIQREPGRYTMHDLLREHARSFPEEDGAVMRLLVHYLHRSRSAVRQMFPANVGDRPGLPPELTPVEPIRDPAEALRWLDAERGNIIATAAHVPRICVGHLAHALRPYLDRQAHHDDAVTLHGIALERSRANGDPDVSGRALADLAWTHWRRGDYERALDCAGQALAVAEDDPFPRSMALHTLGDVAWRRRDTATAERHLKQALDLARIAGDRAREGFVLGDLGMVLDQPGRHEEARRHLDLALALHRRDGNPLGEARVLNQIGALLRHQGRPAEAVDRHREAGRIYRAMGNRTDEAAAFNGLGEAALACGDPEQAIEQHTAAVARGDRPERARAHHGLARALLGLGRAGDAAPHVDEAVRLYQELGVPEAEEARSLMPDSSRRSSRASGGQPVRPVRTTA
ncbi:tetratricopeptide repeat protein [Actinoplanes hulinensis]|uniref:Tetratricopeptide repeat protein n=1 Tax=Actinoplanes hulinensis TaxID=1144547 RepID=A0ABS7AYP7_9ACTN|nr:BTAD domain-containing putative transcriptional regulator [Actinoplanes hulinensis]MBW6433536.1 tetratricopeptide repeat protein [Actinoplanes hulinensis]